MVQLTGYRPNAGSPWDKPGLSGPGVENYLMQFCPGGRGGANKKYINFPFDFTCHFSHGLHDGRRPQDYIFLRKNAGICWRVAEEKKTY